MKKIFLILFAVIGISAVANAQWGYYYTPTYYPTYTPTYYPTYPSYNSSYDYLLDPNYAIQQVYQQQQYFQNVQENLINTTIKQVEEQEYNEYLLFKSLIGEDISYNEYQRIKAEAMNSAEGREIFRELKKESEKQNKEFRNNIDNDRKNRVNKIKEDNKRRANNYEGPKFGL